MQRRGHRRSIRGPQF